MKITIQPGQFWYDPDSNRILLVIAPHEHDRYRCYDYSSKCEVYLYRHAFESSAFFPNPEKIIHLLT